MLVDATHGSLRCAVTRRLRLPYILAVHLIAYMPTITFLVGKFPLENMHVSAHLADIELLALGSEGQAVAFW